MLIVEIRRLIKFRSKEKFTSIFKLAIDRFVINSIELITPNTETKTAEMEV